MVLKREFFSSLLLHCSVVLDALGELLDILMGRDHQASVVCSHREFFCVALSCEINVEIKFEMCVLL